MLLVNDAVYLDLQQVGQLVAAKDRLVFSFCVHLISQAGVRGII